MSDTTDVGFESNLWHLAKFNMFENFSRTDLEAVTSVLHLNEFKKREPIVLPTGRGRRIYFLIKGKAKLSRVDREGKELILEILKPGEIFGQIAFPKEHYTSAMVVALGTCIVGHIHKEDFDKLMSRVPELCLSLNKLIGDRMLKIENRLGELLFRDVPCRLARLLLRLADEYPDEIACGLRIDLLLTQQEVANLIGSTREMVSMTLNRFRRNGWIDVHRRFICLHDLEMVKKLAT